MDLSKIDFQDLMLRSWQVAWRNRGLWLLGWFASFLMNSSGANISNSFNNSSRGGGGSGPDPDVERFLREAWRFWEQNQAIIIGGIVALILFSLVFNLFLLVLGFIGRGGLLRSARLAAANGGRVSFGEAFSAGRDTVGRQFGLWLITDLPFMLIGLFIAGGMLVYLWQMFGNGEMNPRNFGPEQFLALFGPVLFCLIPLGIILGIAGWLAQILNHMGTLATSLEEEPTGFAALQRGGQVLLANFVAFFLIALGLTVFNGVAGFIISLPLIMVMVPLIFAAGLGAAAGNMGAFVGSIAVALLCVAAFFPVGIALSGLFHSFAYNLWANLYLTVTAPAPTSGPTTPQLG